LVSSKYPSIQQESALTSYSPELNPIERVSLYLRERYFSHRPHDSCVAILDAACDAA
jgi:putative transposase